MACRFTASKNLCQRRWTSSNESRQHLIDKLPRDPVDGSISVGMTKLVLFHPEFFRRAPFSFSSSHKLNSSLFTLNFCYNHCSGGEMGGKTKSAGLPQTLLLKCGAFGIYSAVHFSSSLSWCLEPQFEVQW